MPSALAPRVSIEALVSHLLFAHSLNLMDIDTGWTESVALVGKSKVAVQQALDQIRAQLPFALLGVGSDNGWEFINWHLKRWCHREQIQLTRGRPYKKDDNAYIEQKNWKHVRKLLGWERYDSAAAVAAINAVYRQQLRLWMNLYQPSVKLLKKVRVGSKLRHTAQRKRRSTGYWPRERQTADAWQSCRSFTRGWIRSSCPGALTESWRAFTPWPIGD
jgi:transposase InsO family protein